MPAENKVGGHRSYQTTTNSTLNVEENAMKQDKGTINVTVWTELKANPTPIKGAQVFVSQPVSRRPGQENQIRRREPAPASELGRP
jgi:hypothetical protein